MTRKVNKDKASKDILLTEKKIMKESGEKTSKRFELRKLTVCITSTDQIISRARKCQVKAYYFDIFEYIFDLFFSFLLF